jgi:hypothetical protein
MKPFEGMRSTNIHSNINRFQFERPWSDVQRNGDYPCHDLSLVIAAVKSSKKLIITRFILQIRKVALDARLKVHAFAHALNAALKPLGITSESLVTKPSELFTSILHDTLRRTLEVGSDPQSIGMFSRFMLSHLRFHSQVNQTGALKESWVYAVKEAITHLEPDPGTTTDNQECPLGEDARSNSTQLAIQPIVPLDNTSIAGRNTTATPSMTIMTTSAVELKQQAEFEHEQGILSLTPSFTDKLSFVEPRVSDAYLRECNFLKV